MLPCTGSQNATASRPGCTAAPKAGPGTRSGEQGLRSGLSTPRLAARSPFTRLLGACGPLCVPGCALPTSSSETAWRRGLDALLPSCPSGRCGPRPKREPHLYAPGGRQRRGGGHQRRPRPRPRRAARAGQGRVGGWALLSCAARSRLAPPQAEPPSPAPSVSLPCSQPGPLRPAAEPRRPLGSARGCAPLGPGGWGRRRPSPPGWAPRHCQVRASAPEPAVGNSRRGSRGPAACGYLQSGERCAPRLGAHCRLPSPALSSFPFFPRTSLPLLTIFLSLDLSSPSLLSACLPSLPLPSVSPTLLSPSYPVLLHLLFLFAVFFLHLSLLSRLFLFPLSFPSPVPSLSSPLPFPTLLFPTPLSLSFSLLVPPPSPVAGSPPASLFPREGKDCQVCVCSGGGEAQPQPPGGTP